MIITIVCLSRKLGIILIEKKISIVRNASEHKVILNVTIQFILSKHE